MKYCRTDAHEETGRSYRENSRFQDIIDNISDTIEEVPDIQE